MTARIFVLATTHGFTHVIADCSTGRSSTSAMTSLTCAEYFAERSPRAVAFVSSAPSSSSSS
jgi:hypothetical protein